MVKKQKSNDDPPRLILIVEYWDDASPDIRILKWLNFDSNSTRTAIIQQIADMGAQVKQLYAGFTRISEGEVFSS